MSLVITGVLHNVVAYEKKDECFLIGDISCVPGEEVDFDCVNATFIPKGNERSAGASAGEAAVFLYNSRHLH